MYPYQNNQYNPNTNTNNNTNLPRPQQNPNPFSQPQFANQGFLSPQAGSFNANRGVYASTIQASTSSSNLSKPGGFGLGKLESMGRVIKEDPDPVVHRTQETPPSFQPSNNFLQANDRGKLASSVIFQKNFDEDINRFPGFNLSNNNQGGTSKLDALFAKKQTGELPKEQSTESTEERRKREINTIKQDLELLNKRMENTVVRKGDGEAKPYFQLPSRKSAIQNNPPPVNNQSEATKNTFQLNSNHAENTSTSEFSANKAFFQNYKNSSEPVSTYKPPGIQPTQNDPKPIQTPLTNPIKTEAGGMFKKKNPYANE